MKDESTSDPVPPPPPAKPRLISRARATANVVLFISGGLVLLGWLNLALNVGHWEADRLTRLATAIAYAGFIALVAFISSIVLILLENRTAPRGSEGDDA